ncbi:hypothetical protein GCM10020366_38690 [Saccharopolyspora gregorii]|uniref:Uncharacterized protein n=1 Tax=Saccharopolyspora gregorii TaxID=33914 RepID=A0ABP6RSK0_9PSEU
MPAHDLVAGAGERVPVGGVGPDVVGARAVRGERVLLGGDLGVLRAAAEPHDLRAVVAQQVFGPHLADAARAADGDDDAAGPRGRGGGAGRGDFEQALAVPLAVPVREGFAVRVGRQRAHLRPRHRSVEVGAPDLPVRVLLGEGAEEPVHPGLRRIGSGVAGQQPRTPGERGEAEPSGVGASGQQRLDQAEQRYRCLLGPVGRRGGPVHVLDLGGQQSGELLDGRVGGDVEDGGARVVAAQLRLLLGGATGEHHPGLRRRPERRVLVRGQRVPGRGEQRGEGFLRTGHLAGGVAAQAGAEPAAVVVEIDVHFGHVPVGGGLVARGVAQVCPHARGGGGEEVDVLQRERQRGGAAAFGERAGGVAVQADDGLDGAVQHRRVQRELAGITGVRGQFQPGQHLTVPYGQTLHGAQPVAVPDADGLQRVVALLPGEGAAGAAGAQHVEGFRLRGGGFRDAPLGVHLGAVAQHPERVAVEAHRQFRAAVGDGERRGPHHVAQPQRGGAVAGDGAVRELQREHTRQHGPAVDVVVGEEELVAGEPGPVGGVHRGGDLRGPGGGLRAPRCHGHGDGPLRRRGGGGCAEARRGGPFDPVPLPLERVGRQRHLAARGGREARGEPVHLAAHVGPRELLRGERAVPVGGPRIGGGLPGQHLRPCGPVEPAAQPLGQRGQVGGGRGEPVREVRAPGGEAVRHHPGRQARFPVQVREQPPHHLAQRGRSPRREQERVLAGDGGDRSAAVLLQHHVRVGAAGAERAHRGAARPRRGFRPVAGVPVDAERTAVEGERRVRLAEAGPAGDPPVPQRQQRLQHPRDPGGELGVAQVVLDGAQRGRSGGGAGEGSAERAELDGVAELGAGAVRLHQLDAAGFDARRGVHLAQQPLLGGGAGRGQAVGGAVLVDAGGADQPVHVVAVALGVGEPLQQHRARALPGHEPVGAGVEAVAAPGLREHARAARRAVQPRRRLHEHATGDRQVRRAGAQVAAGQVQRHQRTGAGGVGGQRRSAQVQLVGDAGGDDRTHRAPQRLRGRGVVEVVVVVAGVAADVHAAVALAQPFAGVAAVFEGVPALLQEDPLLRVGVGGFDAGHREEHRVEPVDAAQEAAGAAGDLGAELPAGDGFEQVRARDEVVPEGVRVFGVGVAGGHADDGDRLLPPGGGVRCRRGGSPGSGGEFRAGRGLVPLGPGRAQRRAVGVEQVGPQPFDAAVVEQVGGLQLGAEGRVEGVHQVDAEDGVQAVVGERAAPIDLGDRHVQCLADRVEQHPLHLGGGGRGSLGSARGGALLDVVSPGGAVRRDASLRGAVRSGPVRG